MQLVALGAPDCSVDSASDLHTGSPGFDPDAGEPMVAFPVRGHTIFVAVGLTIAVTSVPAEIIVYILLLRV